MAMRLSNDQWNLALNMMKDRLARLPELEMLETRINALGGIDKVEAAMKQAAAPAPQTMTTYPTIATIKTGDGRDMKRVLQKQGRKIGNWAENVMGQDDFKRSVSNKKDEYELCSATAKELTGENVATLRDILDAVIKKGYDKCMPEDGPRLREAYSGTNLIILAMDPIRDSDGDPHIFCVLEYGSDLWLGTSCCSLDRGWSGDFRFVFRRRKAV